MKNAILVAVVLALLPACGVAAGPTPALPSEKPPMREYVDIPLGSAPQHVEMVTRDIPPGGSVPWHTHPGVEIGYLVFGSMEFDMAGETPRLLAPGDSFMAPRGVVHGGRNAGTGPARLVITYVVDKDAPLRLPAKAPEGY